MLKEKSSNEFKAFMYEKNHPDKDRIRILKAEIKDATKQIEGMIGPEIWNWWRWNGVNYSDHYPPKVKKIMENR